MHLSYDIFPMLLGHSHVTSCLVNRGLEHRVDPLLDLGVRIIQMNKEVAQDVLIERSTPVVWQALEEHI